MGAPDAPSDLDVDSRGSDSITLSWSSPAFDGHSPVTSYTLFVERYEVDAFVNEPMITDIALESYVYVASPLTQYRFRVSATNAIGESNEDSNSVTETTEGRAPDAPTNVAFGTATPTSIEVSWKAPEEDGGADVTEYHITVFDQDGTEVDARKSTNTATVVDEL